MRKKISVDLKLILLLLLLKFLIKQIIISNGSKMKNKHNNDILKKFNIKRIIIKKKMINVIDFQVKEIKNILHHKRNNNTTVIQLN